MEGKELKYFREGKTNKKLMPIRPIRRFCCPPT
jgi:hypothetical protein